MKKRIAAALLLALTGLAGLNAVAKTLNTLLIVRTDGKTDRIALSADMEVRPSAEGSEILLIHPLVTAAYPLEAVKNFKFGYYTMSTDKPYVGDYELSAIEEIEAVSGVAIVVRAEGVSVSNLAGETARVSLYNLSGNCVATAPVVDGRAELSLQGLAKGVYVLQAGETTMKIKI